MRRHFFLFRRNNNTRPAEETKWHASLFLQKKITASLFLQKKMERLIISKKALRLVTSIILLMFFLQLKN
jgi:hypothetical protein